MNYDGHFDITTNEIIYENRKILLQNFLVTNEKERHLNFNVFQDFQKFWI